MLWRSIPQSVRAYIYFRVFFLLACSLFPFFSFFFFRWELFSLIWFTHKNTQKLSFLLSSFFFFDDAILAWNVAWLSNFLFFFLWLCVCCIVSFLSFFACSLEFNVTWLLCRLLFSTYCDVCVWLFSFFSLSRQGCNILFYVFLPFLTFLECRRADRQMNRRAKKK